MSTAPSSINESFCLSPMISGSMCMQEAYKNVPAAAMIPSRLSQKCTEAGLISRIMHPSCGMPMLIDWTPYLCLAKQSGRAPIPQQAELSGAHQQRLFKVTRRYNATPDCRPGGCQLTVRAA